MEVVTVEAPDTVAAGAGVGTAAVVLAAAAAGMVAPRDLAVLTEFMLVFKEAAVTADLAAVTAAALARNVLVKVTVVERLAAVEVTVKPVAIAIAAPVPVVQPCALA